MGYGTKLLIVLACLSFTMLLVNAGTMWASWTAFGNTFSFTDLVGNLFAGIIGWATGIITVLLAGAILVGYLTGSNILEALMPYLIGGYIIILVNTVFIVPISNFATDSAVMLPNTLSLFIVVIFNIMLFGLAYSLIRGVDF